MKFNRPLILKLTLGLIAMILVSCCGPNCIPYVATMNRHEPQDHYVVEDVEYFDVRVFSSYWNENYERRRWKLERTYGNVSSDALIATAITEYEYDGSGLLAIFPSYCIRFKTRAGVEERRFFYTHIHNHRELINLIKESIETGE